MSGPWFETFRPVCEKVCAAGQHAHPPSVLLFYVARWCQKATGEPGPDPKAHSASEIEDVVERIARNLADDGQRVDRLFQGDPEELTELRGLLLASARSRCGEEVAWEFAQEALQKIALVLLTGTSPSRAEEGLAAGPKGPSNEYIFTSPFPHWARTVLINLIRDDHRRARRQAKAPLLPPAKAQPEVDPARLKEALDSLPSLLEALRALPRVQHAVMVKSLCRRDVPDIVWEHLREKAPDLFGDDPRPNSDEEIAHLLETTPKLVAANRSAARKKLARDPQWARLLDALLPHRSTRPLPTETESP